MAGRNQITAEYLIEKIKEVGDGCWEWGGSTGSSGYGNARGHVGAHRLAYNTFCGPVPDGMHVCHHCDNRLCIRPSHLFLGTPAGNMVDKIEKGKQSRGEQCRKKMLEEDVRTIRHASAPTRVLAALYGVSKSQIRQIRAGKIWKHIT